MVAGKIIHIRESDSQRLQLIAGIIKLTVIDSKISELLLVEADGVEVSEVANVDDPVALPLVIHMEPGSPDTLRASPGSAYLQ